MYVHGDEEYHMNVRKELCAHITTNQTNYSSLLFHNNIASHLKQMVKPGKWATQVELQAAADYYCIDLYVLTERPTKQNITGSAIKLLPQTQMTRKTIVTEHLPMYSWHTAPICSF